MPRHAWWTADGREICGRSGWKNRVHEV